MSDGQSAWFSTNDQQALDDLWRVYADHGAAIGGEMQQRAAADEAFGAVFRSEPERGSAEWQAFMRCWRPACGADWASCEAALLHCEAFFSARGVGLESWARACMGLQVRLTPLLVGAYAAEPARLGAAPADRAAGGSKS